MKIGLHTFLQVLATIAQFLNLVSGQVPPRWQPYVALAISAIQGFLAWYNHQFTPNGVRIPAGK